MLRKAPFKLLQEIKNRQGSKLFPSFGKICLKVCSRSRGNLLLRDFQSLGLVKVTNCGRKLNVKLTIEGEELLRNLEVVGKGMGI